MNSEFDVLGSYTKLDQWLFEMLPRGYVRAAYAKANFLLFRKLKLIWPVEVETRHHARMVVDKVDRVGGYIYYFRGWEPQISTVIARLLDLGDTILDIGAHIGHHTLLAAQSVGASGRVYAFEPAPRTFGLLRTNIALNQFTNVEARNVAVCDRSGSISLYVAPHENSLRNSLTGDDGRNVIEVPSTRLDDLLDELSCPTIKFVKIDAEGAEPGVLSGAHRLLGMLPADVAILIEVQPETAHSSMDGQGIVQFMAQQGFKPYAINNDYSAANYDAPASLTPLTNISQLTDVFFLRGRLIDRVSDLITPEGTA